MMARTLGAALPQMCKFSQRLIAWLQPATIFLLTQYWQMLLKTMRSDVDLTLLVSIGQMV